MKDEVNARTASPSSPIKRRRMKASLPFILHPASFILSVMFAPLLAFGALAVAVVPVFAAPFAALHFVRALQGGERPERVLYLGEPRADDRRDDLLRRLVARRGLVQWNAPVRVDDDA